MENIPPFITDLVIAGLVLAVLLLRPTPRPRTIYVVSEPIEEHEQRGCLPLIGAVVMLLLMLAALNSAAQ